MGHSRESEKAFHGRVSPPTSDADDDDANWVEDVDDIADTGEEDDEDCDILMLMKSKIMLQATFCAMQIHIPSGVYLVWILYLSRWCLIAMQTAMHYAVPSMLCALNSSVSMAGLNIHASHDIEY